MSSHRCPIGGPLGYPIASSTRRHLPSSRPLVGRLTTGTLSPTGEISS